MTKLIRIQLAMRSQAVEAMESARVVVSRPELGDFEARVRPRVWDALASRLEDGAALIEKLRQETTRIRNASRDVE